MYGTIILLLDDVAKDSNDAIGKIGKMERFRYIFSCVFVTIGENEARYNSY